MKRRDFFKQAGIGSATLASFPALAHALARAAGTPSTQDPVGQPTDTFSILLSGPYTHVTQGPNLGLSGINLSDGTYSTTKIFPIFGLPRDDDGQDDRGDQSEGHDCETERAIGNFFVQFRGSMVAYQLPHGAIAMMFTVNNLVSAPDGQGGLYRVGTVLLDITDATGIYQSFIGGHNEMVDILHRLADGTFVEHCICVISRP